MSLSDGDRSHLVKFTPLFGGKSDGAVCSLLELGSIRILMDCGKDISLSIEEMVGIVDNLKANGGVDLILLSHADTQHIAGLPHFLSQNGGLGVGELAGVPMLCTVPVLKYSRMSLYEHCLQVLTEHGGLDNGLPERNARNKREMETYLDAVDRGFSGAVTVKYYEERVLLDVLKESWKGGGSGGGGETVGDVNASDGSARAEALLQGLTEVQRAEMGRVRLCAFPSGRTIGGTVWKITHNGSDILYVTAASLRKEGILDGCGGSLSLLGEGHPLLLLDSASYSSQPGIRSTVTNTPTSGTSISRTKAAGSSKREDAVLGTVIPPVLETLRRQGNVVLPVDAGGRVLELLYGLNKYWNDNQGMRQYPLVFLSHMGSHLKAYAQCQLEWTSDSVCKGFYAGHSNPFALNEVSFFSSVKDMEVHFNAREKLHGRPSPKVVVVTDASLSYGLSKELLIKWGGDPRNSVMMTDYPPPGSLAAEVVSVVSSGAPCIVSVTRLQRVVLSAAELEELEKEREQERIVEEEANQRARREEELAALSLPGRKRKRRMEGGLEGMSDSESDEGTDEEEEEEEEEEEDAVGRGVAIASGGSGSGSGISSSSSTPAKRALAREASVSAAGAATGTSGSTLAKYTVSKHKTFDNKRGVIVCSTNATNAVTCQLTTDEYGSSIADLNFQAAVSATVASVRRGQGRHGREESYYNPNVKAPPPQQQAVNSTATATGPSAGLGGGGSGATIAATTVASVVTRTPTKLVEVTSRIQFTCSFQTLYRVSVANEAGGSNQRRGGRLGGKSVGGSSGVSGHADYRQLRILLQQLKPKRVVLFHGDGGDTKTLAQYAKTTLFAEDEDLSGGDINAGSVGGMGMGIVSLAVDHTTGAVSGARGLFCPDVGTSVQVMLRSSAVRLIIPNALAPTSRLVPVLSHRTNVTSGTGIATDAKSAATTSGTGEVVSHVCSLSGAVKEIMLSKLSQQKSDQRVVKLTAVTNDPPVCYTAGSSIEQQEESKLLFTQMVPTVGAVSIGEVTLTQLKMRLEAAGISVEYQRNMTVGTATALTGSLICNHTVVIHKTHENDFSLEGPCTPLYYKVRAIVYNQMSFVY